MKKQISRVFRNLIIKKNYSNLFTEKTMQPEYHPEIWRNFVCVQQPTYLNKQEVEEQTSQVLLLFFIRNFQFFGLTTNIY